MMININLIRHVGNKTVHCHFYMLYKKKKKRENFSFTIHLTGVACQGADLTTSAFPLVLVDQLSSHGKCVGN